MYVDDAAIVRAFAEISQEDLVTLTRDALGTLRCDDQTGLVLTETMLTDVVKMLVVAWAARRPAPAHD